MVKYNHGWKMAVEGNIGVSAPGRKRIIFLITASIAAPLLFLSVLRCSALTSGETCVDAYYHTAIADTGPSLFMGRSFPYTTMSVWENNFSDKELLYHVILSGLRSWQGTLGFQKGAPFNFPVLFFAGLMLCVFTYVVFRLGLRRIWIYALLLVCVSPSFTSRVLMLRPHLAGITLMLAAAWFSAQARDIRRLPPLFLTGFIAAWTYSNPHFILLPVFAFSIFTFRQNKKSALCMPLAATIGIFAGLLLHPQFPDTFLTWKIQCVDVIMQILKKDNSILVGEENRGIDMQWLKYNILLIAVILFNASAFAVTCAKRGFKNISAELKAFSLISAVTVIGTSISARTIEYACPFSVLTAGLLIKETGREGTHFRRASMPIFSLLIAAGMIYTGCLYFRSMKNGTFMAPLKFAEWIERTDIPKGTVIANLCWSDFPALYYALPQYRYLAGLDPMFAYARDPEAIKKLEAVRTGKINMPPGELAALTGARFAYVSIHGRRLSEHLYRNGYKLLYQDDEGCLFHLTAGMEAPPATRPSGSSTRD